eukprot:CAMPEP_0204322474 /NCGR_PEP_ID=MMETSP0469-20131031/8704_1 /ASSEMBLY_ACC=CAM_ASM_000384 /TAXON_ID=2969 /ORGANISM="Oxyrrhis marina" /LENGTH=259 /DNA_ID=CAMNT_0051303815 /DNA_START=49 /DNA_END=824 /DNA_ORIENTATION=+
MTSTVVRIAGPRLASAKKGGATPALALMEIATSTIARAPARRPHALRTAAPPVAAPGPRRTTTGTFVPTVAPVRVSPPRECATPASGATTRATGTAAVILALRPRARALSAKFVAMSNLTQAEVMVSLAVNFPKTRGVDEMVAEEEKNETTKVQLAELAVAPAAADHEEIGAGDDAIFVEGLGDDNAQEATCGNVGGGTVKCQNNDKYIVRIAGPRLASAKKGGATPALALMEIATSTIARARARRPLALRTAAPPVGA